MSLLVLPVIIVAAQEAIRAVPRDLREASYGMGATKWQTICESGPASCDTWHFNWRDSCSSRAIGETAPLVVVGIPLFIAFLPQTVMDTFTVLPMQIYNWTSRPQEEFQAGGCSRNHRFAHSANFHEFNCCFNSK